MARARTLAPDDVGVIQFAVLVELARGDLTAARAQITTVPESVSPTDLVAYMATYGDLAWVLDSAQTELLLRLGPGAFDDDRATYASVMADAWRLRGDARRAAAYADSAARQYTRQLAEAPDDPQLIGLRGVAFAMSGRKADAIADGERAVSLLPISANADLGPYLQHQLARIHLLTGNAEKAIDLLEPLLRVPYYLTPGWLRIDPSFAALRGKARFQKLVGS